MDKLNNKMYENWVPTNFGKTTEFCLVKFSLHHLYIILW